MLRIGILGASRVATYALLAPARDNPDVQIVAIASRELARAEAYAATHGIARAFDSYDRLVESPDVDAVYVGLPNSRHCEWSVKSLAAGKHVLCEKPFAANAQEATAMLAAADGTARLLMEAHHCAFHPAYRHVRSIVQEGAVGRIVRIEIKFLAKVPATDDLRFRYELGGGAGMDVGCYAVHLARFITGEEPVVRSAQASLVRPNVDGRMDAVLEFPSGAHATLACSIVERLWGLRFTLRVVGSEGILNVRHPWAPHLLLHSITIVDKNGKTRRDRVVRRPSTYVHQLRAFAAAAATPAAFPAIDAQRTMAVIDRMYERAGLSIRGDRTLIN